ncbi:MAG: ABC transporter substrate-binding protein, partial [Planctomycetota bacterium]|nr:ABC transporter substrate-binding protein [Planctomycetota bacterium]
MRHNPVLGAFLVIVNLAAVFLAAYLAIDALDQSRLQSARTEQSLNRLSDALDRLGDRVGASQAAAPAPSGRARAVPQAEDGGPKEFVNNNLRDPKAEYGGGLVSRTQALPGNLNMIVNNDAMVSSMWSYLVDSLAERNLDDLTKFEPVMAERWEVSPDGLEYTIHLRKNVMWQPYVDPVTKKEVAAKPVTSGDFLFFWNTIQNKNVPCEPLRVYYEDLEGIGVVDDHTFTVRWKQPYSMAENFTLGMQPLPEHYYRPDPSWSDEQFAEEFTSSQRNQWIVGTGPYKLVKWDKNQEVMMERDENYFGPAPYIQTRRIRLIPDNSVSFLEFKSGRLDSYGLLPEQWFEETPE